MAKPRATRGRKRKPETIEKIKAARASQTPEPAMKHGAYSLEAGGDLPEHASWIRPRLEDLRRGIVEDLGGEAVVSTAQQLLIEDTLTAHGVVCLLAQDLKSYGIYQNGNRGGGELRPALRAMGSYLNTVRLNLCALGLERRAQDVGSLDEYLQREYGNADGSAD